MWLVVERVLREIEAIQAANLFGEAPVKLLSINRRSDAKLSCPAKPLICSLASYG
jgi:hypothetical protein